MEPGSADRPANAKRAAAIALRPAVHDLAPARAPAGNPPATRLPDARGAATSRPATFPATGRRAASWHGREAVFGRGPRAIYATAVHG